MLEVGTVEEEITVTADAPLIETSNASLGDSLDREILEMLPAPGRNAYLIAVTIPTMIPVGDPQFNRQQDQSNASRWAAAASAPTTTCSTVCKLPS